MPVLKYGNKTMVWKEKCRIDEFRYLGCVLDESGTYETECSRKVMSGRRVAGVIRSLVNDRSLQLECVKVFHESLLMPVLRYGSKTMI